MKKRLLIFGFIMLFCGLSYVSAADLDAHLYFCEKDGVVMAMNILHVLLIAVKILVPFLLIFTGTIDLAKAVINDKDAFPKAMKKFTSRLLIGVAIFFIPTVVSVLVKELGGEDIESGDPGVCVKCVLDGDCQSYTKYGE